jgi:transcriptional regulator with XRE-family HTH domain
MSDAIHPVDLRVGQNVRRIRIRRGMSQTVLANSVGITFQQIQKYEKGTNRVSASMMHDIARTLDVEIMALFAEIDTGNENAQFSVPKDTHFIEETDLRIIEKLSRIGKVEIKKNLLMLIDVIAAADSTPPA